MIKLLLMLVLTIGFSGCVTLQQDYTPETPLRKNQESVQYDLTYSTHCVADFSSYMKGNLERHLKGILDEKIRESNFFSSLTYTDMEEKSRYHLHFIASYAVDHALIFGVDAYFDLSLLLYYNGKKVFSCSTSDKARSYPGAVFLLPFGVIGPKKVWTRQERNCVNYLLNQMTDFQKKQLGE